MEQENLDLGRDLQRCDIVDPDTFPLEESAVGEVHCYLCVAHGADLRTLAPLTRSSGVFTSAITCDMDAPVYVCLEHMPHRYRQFEAFAPEVEAILVEKQHERRQAKLAA